MSPDDGLLTEIRTPTTTYGLNYGVFGLRENITIGGRTLISYSYTPNNYLLDRMTYGNNDFVEYDYDAYGRVQSETYEDGDIVTYHYDNDGALVAVTDEAAQITTRQYFDLSGRNVGYSEIGTDFTHRVGYTYNTDNNLSEQVENINGTETVSSYTYDDDNRVTELTTDGITVAYTYDGFGRVSQQVTKIKAQSEEAQDTVLLTEVFTFNDTATLASTQVQSYKTYKGTVSDENLIAEYHYTYDENGNITSVYNGSTWIYYAYDSANQLTREDNQRTSRTYTWVYDNAGNILRFNTHAYTRAEVGEAITVEYGYDTKENEADEDYWGDLLISLDGQTVTYEYQQATEVLQEDGTTKTCYNIGNPTQLNGRTYTWEHGRRLATMTKGSVQWTYTYNNAGLRTSRSNGTTTYKYIYDGSLLKRMTITNSDGTEHVDFTYDAGGTPLTMTYQGSTYYYIVNLQGDVEGLLDADGNRVLTYYYTAYGQGKYLAGEHALTNTLININPLGYRGYIHDVGTGLYYCQSRYYDPVIGRFINADGLVATGQGLTGNNMFAYGLNNPVIYGDPDGYDAVILLNEESYGHIGLLIQDSRSGEWYHFYWGRATGSDAIEVGMGRDVDVLKQLIRIDTKSDVYITMREVEEAGVFNGHYDESIYLKGNFTVCLDAIRKYEAPYNVYGNNCSQVSFGMLSIADTEYRELLRTVADNYITPVKAFAFFHKVYIGELSIDDVENESISEAIAYFVRHYDW